MIRSVILVDDDKPVREALGQTLELADFKVIKAASFIEATDHISADFDGVVITDVRMPGKDGFALLERCNRIDPDIPVILLTGEGDIPMAVQAVNAGAFNFLEKPCPPKQLIEVAEKACDIRTIVLENREFKRKAIREDAAARLIVGRSEPVSRLRDQLRTVANAKSDLLITGETGVGKELAARTVHELSSPRGEFIAVNCGMLTNELTNSVLFGDESRTGAFRRSNNGTLFLDEIGAMRIDQQASLLRVLQDRKIEGENGQEIDLSCRVIAATNQDLAAMVREGSFREDLFFRLDVARVNVPSLRERPDDIGGLFRIFLGEACARLGLPLVEADEKTFSELFTREWRGNVRELKNYSERYAMGIDEVQHAHGPMSLNAQLDLVERQIISECLRRNNGQVKLTCEELNLPRKTLYDRMKKHSIRPEDFRKPN